MFNVTPRFASTVKQSHTMVTLIEALDPTGRVMQTVDADDGSIVESWSDAVHRSGTLQVLDPDDTLIPLTAADPLSPFTARLRYWRGIQYPDGTQELVPLGVYKVSVLDAAEDKGKKPLALTLLDLSSQCQQPLDTAVGIPGGTAIESAIALLLQAAVPTMGFRMAKTGLVTPPLLVTEARKVWDEASAIAEMAGFDLVMGRTGLCEMVPRIGVASTSTPQWEFVEGANADFWKPSRRISSDLYPNVVVVIGTNTTATTVRAMAADTNPLSSTYIHGPYGKVVKVVRSARITSNTQAQQAANGILQRQLGPAETLTFEAIPNPALDIGDTVRITRESLGIHRRPMLVSKIDLPHKAQNPMIVTAQQSVFTDEEMALQLAGALTGIMPAASSGLPVAS